jgi:hypothetical protein
VSHVQTSHRVQLGTFICIDVLNYLCHFSHWLPWIIKKSLYCISALSPLYSILKEYCFGNCLCFQNTFSRNDIWQDKLQVLLLWIPSSCFPVFIDSLPPPLSLSLILHLFQFLVFSLISLPLLPFSFFICQPPPFRLPIIQFRCFMLFFSMHLHTCHILDCLCGLVVRVPGYRSRGPGFDSRHFQIFWEVVGLEQGPLRLVKGSIGCGLENPD